MFSGMGLLDTTQSEAVFATMARSSAKMAIGDFARAVDGWNSVRGDYGGDYPGKSFSGATLFENFTVRLRIDCKTDAVSNLPSAGHRNAYRVGQTPKMFGSRDGDPNIPNYGDAIAWLGQPIVRKAIHIGNLSVGQKGLDQYKATILSGDVMNSSKVYIEGVLQAGIRMEV